MSIKENDVVLFKDNRWRLGVVLATAATFEFIITMEGGVCEKTVRYSMLVEYDVGKVKPISVARLFKIGRL